MDLDDTDVFEFIDLRIKTVYHVPVSKILSPAFLDDVSMKLNNRRDVTVNGHSDEAIFRVNKLNWLFKDFADCGIHVQRMGVGEPLTCPVIITQKGKIE